MGVTWKQADSLLKSPNVTTIRQLFLALSELDVDQRTKAYYTDTVARQADFDPLDKYIAEMYLQAAHIEAGKKLGKDMTPEAVRGRIQKRIHWKNANGSLDQVTRVYDVLTHPTTKAERVATWDKHIYFHVFTDDQGELLGWYNTAEDSEPD